MLLISVPKFRETGQVVLLDLETNEVEVLEIGVVQPASHGGTQSQDQEE